MVRSFLQSLRLGMRYWGTAMYCPLCERTARVFLPNTKELPGQKTIDRYHIVAMGKRSNYRCPWCNSTDKERLVWWYLSQLSLAGKRILHVAPERVTRRKLEQVPGIDYVCGDKFYGHSRYSDGRYEGAENIDITSLPYTEQSFDLIICNHVLEHVEDDTRALSELYRVLKPGGQAIPQVPISYDTPTIEDRTIQTEKEREIAFGQVDHVRIYGTDYPSRLEQAGFSVIDIGPEDRPSLDRLGVNPREHLYIANRPLPL